MSKICCHSVQEVVENEKDEIRVDTRIRTYILINHNRPDIFIYDKTINEIVLTEMERVRIISKLWTSKKRKYDLLSNEMGLLYKTKTIPYVITWDGMLTKYHKSYLKELNINSLLKHTFNLPY
ncbi:hypothetical protein TCON_0031 [Astathelohania contejeani]|uniref:Uncharacterized protein n=1 Tax=Astathelohania contejeani TaxID=164912 RepID=A0ABQ7I312_9MICR|nr:hypothetical protein TCON_0031 [Thelohania contejeani]